MSSKAKQAEHSKSCGLVSGGAQSREEPETRRLAKAIWDNRDKVGSFVCVRTKQRPLNAQ